RAQRDDEIQADELSVLLVARAGYDPHAVETMLRAVAAGQGWDDDRSDPHPSWTERVARIQVLAAQQGTGERRAEVFRTNLAGLVVDDDPRSVATVGQAVVLAHTRVAIDLPTLKSATATARGLAITLTSGETVWFWPIPRTLVPMFPNYANADVALV